MKKELLEWVVAICVATTIAIAGAMSADAAENVKVIDGDTIVLGTGEIVRLYGVDAPEKKQPGGIEARDWLVEKITGYNLRVERRGKDYRGRTVAIIFKGNTSVNKALVQEGLAWAYREYATLYVASEQDARTAQRGLWEPGLQSVGSTCPQAPWHWREDHR